MTGLLLPVGRRDMASWQVHIDRGTPSSEPGTDFYCPPGTPVLAPADGEIWGYGTSVQPATGRWVGVNFANGMSFRCMHHAELRRTSGRVFQGDLLALSGSSGYGSEYFGEPYRNSAFYANTGGDHTHVTLWPTWDHIFGYRSPGVPYTIDFMDYVDTAALPLPIGETTMYIRALNAGAYARAGHIYTNDIGGHWRGVSNLEGDGYITPLANAGKLPLVEFNGTDLDLLFAMNGVWEQATLGGDVRWGGGINQLLGLGALTGRLMYPGTNTWHYPTVDDASDPAVDTDAIVARILAGVAAPVPLDVDELVGKLRTGLAPEIVAAFAKALAS